MSLVKPLNFFEITTLVESLKDKLPARLQEISSSDFGVALAMYSRIDGPGESWWLFFDLSPLRPGFFFQSEKGPWSAKKKPTPVSLFLNSHAKGLYLKHVELIHEYGRIVQFIFGNSHKEVIIDFEVIPRSGNLLVKTSDGKKISWNKPRERQEVQVVDVMEARSFKQIMKEWNESFTAVKDQKKSKGEATTLGAPKADILSELFKKRQKDLEKKKRALVEIEKTLTSDEDKSWFALGELLKWQTLKDLAPEWTSFIDSKITLQENRERAFQKGKQLQDKKTGTLKRKEILLKEIASLESSTPSDELTPKPKSKVPTLKDTKLRKKTSDSGFVAHMGKSATDNIKLLRQSQPWDLWVHLRDYPSSHAIIHRNKNQNIPQKDIEEVAEWLAAASLGQKQILAGQKIDAMFAECRHVKPIKGDKLGRVHYQNEKTLTIRLQK